MSLFGENGIGADRDFIKGAISDLAVAATVASQKFGVQVTLHPNCPLSGDHAIGFVVDDGGDVSVLDNGGYGVTEDLQVVSFMDLCPNRAAAQQLCAQLNGDFGHQVTARAVGPLRQQFSTQQQAEDYRMALLLAAITPDDSDLGVMPVMASLFPVMTAVAPCSQAWPANLPLPHNLFTTPALAVHSCGR
jgi:hypothetical protein